MAPRKAARKYRGEVALAQESLFDRLMEVRGQADDIELQGARKQVVQIAQSLVTSGMPYRATTDRQLVRSSRTPDGNTLVVTYHAMGTDVVLPYGADRTLLYWLIDQAIKRQDPFVPWESCSEYMRDIGLTDGGSNYRKVRDAFERISRCAITVERTTASDTEHMILPIIDASRLPRRGAESSEAEQRGIEFSPRFFSEIVSRHVPFPWSLMRAVDKKPQMQDLIVFCYWRMYVAKTESLIPWESLRQQIWYADTNPHRIRQRFAEAAAAMAVVWPQTRRCVESQPKGLWIAPLPPGCKLLA